MKLFKSVKKIFKENIWYSKEDKESFAPFFKASKLYFNNFDIVALESSHTTIVKEIDHNHQIKLKIYKNPYKINERRTNIFDDFISKEDAKRAKYSKYRTLNEFLSWEDFERQKSGYSREKFNNYVDPEEWDEKAYLIIKSQRNYLRYLKDPDVIKRLTETERHLKYYQKKICEYPTFGLKGDFYKELSTTDFFNQQGNVFGGTRNELADRWFKTGNVNYGIKDNYLSDFFYLYRYIDNWVLLIQLEKHENIIRQDIQIINGHDPKRYRLLPEDLKGIKMGIKNLINRGSPLFDID